MSSSKEMWNERGITSCHRKKKKNVSSFRHKAQQDESSYQSECESATEEKEPSRRSQYYQHVKGRHVYTDGLILPPPAGPAVEKKQSK